MNKWYLAALALLYLSVVITGAVIIGKAVQDDLDDAVQAALDDAVKTGGTCRDPIDESHRGLQWRDRGPLGQHLAIDFVAAEATEVRAIADGHVAHYLPESGFYGGCDGKPGPVLITRHPGGTHGSFAVQYGHVRSSLKKSEKITAGQVVGRVINYKPCCDTPAGCPHLHFAIWDAASEHPSAGMGYGAPRSFVDPDWFFRNDLCASGSSPGTTR